MYALYSAPPPPENTRPLQKTPTDITVVLKVDGSPFAFSVRCCRPTQKPECSSAFDLTGADFRAEPTDTVFGELKKQEATLQNERDIFFRAETRCPSKSTRLL